MKIADVKNLKVGDKVYYNDPDDGIRSGVLTIKTISIVRDRWITIENENGFKIECIPSEISLSNNNAGTGCRRIAEFNDALK